MASYSKDKNGLYKVKFRINGKSTTKRGFATKRDAEMWFNKHSLENNFELSPHFQEVCKSYLERVKATTEYGTFMKAETFVNKIIIPNFCNKRINLINELDCHSFRTYVSSLDKYSTTYKNDILLRFRQIFKHAIKFYRLERDPSIVCDRFKYTRQEKQLRRDRQLDVWTTDEFKLFIDNVENTPFKQFFITLYFTGLRKGEALALTWKDLELNRINIDKSLTRKTENGGYEIKEPKTIHSIRKVSLNDSLYNYLLEFKTSEMLNDRFSEDWFMFGRVKPLAETTIERIKKEAVEKTNQALEPSKRIKNIRIHDFRHSHATNLISNDINIVAVSRRLGHSDINTTLETYTHLLKKNDEALTDNIEENFKNVVKMRSTK